MAPLIIQQAYQRRCNRKANVFLLDSKVACKCIESTNLAEEIFVSVAKCLYTKIRNLDVQRHQITQNSSICLYTCYLHKTNTRSLISLQDPLYTS